MKRVSLMAAAAGIFCFLAGCTAFDLAGVLSTSAGPQKDEYVVAGSVEAVAEASVRSLERLGIQAKLSPVGETVHVTGETKKGGRFVLVFLNEDTAKGEKTRIQLHWLERNGDQLDLRVLAERVPHKQR